MTHAFTPDGVGKTVTIRFRAPDAAVRIVEPIVLRLARKPGALGQTVKYRLTAVP